MDRPTKILVVKSPNNVEIYCIDCESGSGNGFKISFGAYKALAKHFRTGELEIYSDELNNVGDLEEQLNSIDEKFNKIFNK